ncbi:PTS sugar transporter subunit IIA [Streptomyces sclerotialus]|uniref:PTS sugar transporter subunit IIA n=1 Tax=Streptomyces sclerotialus TaxID=1957 RepID=UPI0004C53FD2
MPTLSELIPADAVRLDVTVADWREAVRAAGDLMVATGAATGEYTTEMIENVEENGPYIVIAPGFAFAHARPSPAVLETGMSWVRLAEPVEFGHESNDPVSLVVGLAARDSGAHTEAMAALARLLGDPETERALRAARTPEALRAVLAGPETPERPSPSAETPEYEAEPGRSPGPGRSQEPGRSQGPGRSAETGQSPERQSAGGSTSVHKILTVCGNGLGTSLFLKNTLEQVLDRWGWSKYVSVEATDTISAKGKAGEAVAILTSGEIARTLGDVGVPVKVVENFTSTGEVDRILRDTYDVQ